MEAIEIKPKTEAHKARLQRRKMRKVAKQLFIKPLTPTSCLVWGGENEHVVSIVNEELICDCLGWEVARNHNCSHVMKFRITYGDLKK